MRPGFVLISLIVFVGVVCGCVTQSSNSDITVTGLDTLEVPQMNIGSFDVYTEHYQIENPSNRTLTNVEVDLTIIPVTSYCHQQDKKFSYPVLTPKQKVIEQVSFIEFSGLDCEYNYSYGAFTQT